MADQKINALPTKTSPSTGDKMLMIGTAEEYQIDYDQLATAILNKLSTQSFSSLDTTSKTVLGAIDELNSKIISFVTMNDTVDINTGYVDLNFPLNEYFFFKFVCAAGNVSSTGNLYEENMMVGFSYHVPCGKGYIRFNIESLTRINILENTSGYNFRYAKALKK